MFRRLVAIGFVLVMARLDVLAQPPTPSFICTVENRAVGHDTLYFDVYILSTGVTTVYLGTSDFVLTFNSGNFTDPTLTVIQQGAPGGKIENQYTAAAEFATPDRAILNLAAPTVGNPTQFTQRVEVVSTVAPGTLIARVAISGITIAAGTAGLTWRLDIPNNTNVHEFLNINPSYPQRDSTSTGAFTDPTPDIPLPVELTSFTVATTGAKAVLHWVTATEKNNYGFQVQRRKEGDLAYADVEGGFVAGHGTTNVPQSYSFTDQNTFGGPYSYRLKQIDLDGAVTYYLPTGSNGTTTDVTEIKKPTEFNLTQNYPNPFNPTTRIQYALPKDTQVKLEVFDVIGQKIATLVDAAQPAGYYDSAFDATGLPSGIYFYRLTTPETSFLKKMMVLK